MADLSFIDLITPYILRGAGFGPWHPALTALSVDEHETASSVQGVNIRGAVHFHTGIRPYFDTSRMVMGADAEDDDNHPLNDPSRRDPWFDLRDLSMQFELTVPRTPSVKVQTAEAMIGAPNFGPTKTVLDLYAAAPFPSDYPRTEFVLDFIIIAELHAPFLRGAKLDDSNGQLVPDPQNERVTFTLPKIKIRLSQGSNLTDPLNVTLLSAGASGLDDPGDTAVSEMLMMSPPYAFFGHSDVVGFGFRSAILDLSNASTPPDVLAQFGYDESWTGLYLPEIRLFIAPKGSRDLAVDGGVRNLLIGLGQSHGVTGDFELEVLNQGAGLLTVSARFYDLAQRGYGITYTENGQATVQLPERTTMVIDVGGGRVPYQATATIDGVVSQIPPGSNGYDIDLTNVSQRTIELHATDSSDPPQVTQLTVVASRQQQPNAAPAGTQPSTQTTPVEVFTTSVMQGTTPVAGPRLRRVNTTPKDVTVGLDTPTTQSPAWKVNGDAKGSSETLTFDVQPGVNYTIEATVPADNVGDSTAYFRFDHPGQGAGPGYSTNPANSRTVAAPDQGSTTPWEGGSDSMSALGGTLTHLNSGATITIQGYASYEGPDPPQSPTLQQYLYNQTLAQRRADGLKAMIDRLTAQDSPVAALKGRQYTYTVEPFANMNDWQSQGGDLEARRQYWKATAKFGPTPTDPVVVEGTAHRKQLNPPPITQPKGLDPAPSAPKPPSWFLLLGGKVRIIRNQFVACEVFGRFDIQTAAEKRLKEGQVSPAAGQTLPQPTTVGSNPQNLADGVIDARVVVQFDDATDTVTVTGTVGADPADRDGLMLWGRPPGQKADNVPPTLGLNFLGESCLFMPLISDLTGSFANQGAMVELPITIGSFGLIGVLATTDWMRTERVIWYGGELKVVATPRRSTNAPLGEWSTTLLCDIETAVSANFLKLVTIDRDTPLVVRYKAIGLMFGAPPGQPAFQFRPMFDSSRGYTIDVGRPGAIKVASPLDKILKILAARIARSNPLAFEVDLGFGVDLGVVSIDRARLRAVVTDGQPDPKVELTAFGAGVNIPGALRGHGYLELNANEIKGSIDLTLVPVKVRVAAGVGVTHVGSQTGVIVDLDVDFPVAIPLGSSGLGIYGFLGLFAMHYARNESMVPADNQAPALAWFQKSGGDVTQLQFWQGQAGHWAFGIGALLGTMGSSVIFNLKGVLLLELPGPRLLLMMRANLLVQMKPLTNPLQGVFFAVIDLDMGRGTLTIGISAEFKVKSLLRIQIPVEAFFNFNNLPDWHLYLGRYDKQIQADILEVFEGTGYLMLSGNGIPAHNQLPQVTGFSIGVGLHVSFVWGSKSAGLYAELAAGFDAAVGFDPFRFAGILYVRGELHLFIIGISAWANLHADMGEDAQGHDISRIAGQICGEIELLFFTISGCVDFEVGADSIDVPDPPPLIKGLKLISRSPALVIGTGVDRPIDGGIGDGAQSAAPPPNDQLPVVPIDAIPVLMMSAPPVYDGVTFKNGALQGSPDTPSDGWVARGDTWFTYKLNSVDLPGGVSAGATPATWWAPKSGDKVFEAQLALLSWIPEATPKAIEYSKHLEDWVKEYWGTICLPAAPPTSFLLTFMHEVLGASPAGWWLNGIAWPDPPGTIRSQPSDVDVRVTERWRCGNKKLDQLRGVVPAEVQSAAVYCPPVAQPTTLAAAAQPSPDVIGTARGRKVLDVAPPRHLMLSEAARMMNIGAPVSRAAITTVTGGVVASAAAPPGCESRVLASPLYEDHWRLSNPPANNREQFVRDSLALTKYTPGPLVDAVTFLTGDVQRATFYLFVPGLALESHLLNIDVMSPTEAILRSRLVTSADTVPGVAFPSRWDDPSGPWYADMYRLKQHQSYLAQWGYSGVLVTIDGATGGDRIQIGLRVQDPKQLVNLTARAFYVAAVELVRKSEVVRSDFDNKQQGHKQSIAGTVLSSNAADYALLEPGQTYKVIANWDASRERRPQGKSPQDHKDVPNNTQTFWFRTDDKPPARLDPWMLASTPDEGEKHFFTEAGMKLVFATTNVVRLYETYNKKLQVGIKAASMRPTATTPQFPKQPIVLDNMVVTPVAKSVVDPFEDALELALDTTCVPAAGNRNRHSQVDLPIPLEPFTDYVLDIEMVDDGAQEGERIWRRSFSTGAFASLLEFANSFFTTRVKHHAVAPGVLQAVANQFAAQPPQGGEFDDAMIKAGIEPLEVPDQPRLIVFWETDGNNLPQPVAAIIDSSEPLWRSRLLPREINDPTPDGNKRYELKPVTWLEPVEDPVILQKAVKQIIPIPGGQRAFVVLDTARGGRLCLKLRRIAQLEPYLDGPGATDQYELIADLKLDSAPWEEVD